MTWKKGPSVKSILESRGGVIKNKNSYIFDFRNIFKSA